MFRCVRLPSGAAAAGHMFQRKVNEIFKELSNVFSIAGDVLVVGYKDDSTDHDRMLQNVLGMVQNQTS